MQLFSFYVFICAVTYSNGDEKFVKNYAMLKIFESCFGREVLQQTRKEIKQAVWKCTAHETPSPSKPSVNYGDGYPKNQNQLRPSFIAYRPNNPYPYAPNLYSGYQTPGAMLYQVPFQQSYGFPSNGLLFFGKQYYGNQRTARDMDTKNFTSRMTGFVKNVTCVMQTLGYLDENFEPNFSKIEERVRRMAIPKELRNDIQEGLSFCKLFSKCIPEDEVENNPLPGKFSQPAFFFKCFKHKKLEACILKDVRENRLNLDEIIGSEMDDSSSTREMDELAASVYEFLYGSSSNEDIGNFFES